MLLLAFDTATPAVTVALHDGKRTLASSVATDAHRHAELLAPAIAAVIADAGASRDDLTMVAAGVGPGPFTGLRVGVVTARVLASTLGIPGYGVCTLDVIAAGTGRQDEFLVTTDARRREVYWARYEGMNRLAGPDVARPSEVLKRELPVAGAGAGLYPAEFPNPIVPEYPDAGVLADLVARALRGTPDTLPPQTLPPQTLPLNALLPLEPLYLRRPDVREPGARKRVLQP